MRRSILGLALAGAMTSLTACGVDTPSAPVTRAPELSAVTQAWAAYDPDGIRRTGGTLFTTSDWKRTAQPLFNEADKLRKAGKRDQARVLYYQFLSFTLDKYKRSLLQTPSNFESARDGVFFIFSSVLSGAAGPGEDPVVHNLEIVIDNVAANEFTPIPGDIDTRYQLCVIANAAALAQCGNRSGTAANVLDPNFVVRPALFLIEPWGSITDYADFGSTWTGNWRMRVEPIYAQASFAAAATPEAHTAICAAEQEIEEYSDDHDRKNFHAPVSMLQVAQAPESGGDTDLLEKLNNESRRDSLKKMLGGCHNSVVARGDAPFGNSYLGRRGWYALNAARGTLGQWMAPKSLHAVDGGLGGRTTIYKSFFAGVEPPSLHIRSLDPTIGIYGTDSLPAAIPTQSSQTVYASQTAYGTIVTPQSCTWVSSHARIKIVASGAGSATAVLSTTGSAGTADVTATCTLISGAQQATTVTFTVGT